MFEAPNSYRNRRRNVTVRVPADHPPAPARGPPPTVSSSRLGDARNPTGVASRVTFFRVRVLAHATFRQ